MNARKRRVLGARKYADISQEKLEECLSKVRSGVLTQTEGALQYGIARKTIYNKLNASHPAPFGRQPALSSEEERTFAQHLIAVSEFGFPVTKQDLCIIVKEYLDKNYRKVSEFHDNMPGYRWI